MRRTLRVEVGDLGPRPHGKAAIRCCFTGWGCSKSPTNDFHVEVWKWKKLDICSDTIFIAAPSSRDVYLYSSTNTAVLWGWASESGLCRLTRVGINNWLEHETSTLTALWLYRLTMEVHPKVTQPASPVQSQTIH